MPDEVIKNDDIHFGPADIDPATGEPRIPETDVITDDKLSDDQKGHLTSFAPDIDGASFNSKGDIVDSEGKVVLAKADLDVKLDANPGETEDEKAIRLAKEKAEGEGGDGDEGTPEEKATKLIADSEGELITIDGVEYKIKDGAAVDTADAVKITKEELQTKMVESLGDEVSGDDDYISELSTLTGYTPVDDKGAPVEYENDVEGIAKFISDTVRQEGTRLHQEQQNGFFTQYPQMKDAYNFLRVNNNLEGYGQVTDHSKVKLDKDNEGQLTEIIIKGEMLRGRTKEQAQRQVKYAKDDNRLLEESTDNLTFIQGRETAAAADRASTVAAADKVASDTAKEYWGGIKTTIDGGTLEGYVIPENIQIRDENDKVITKNRTDFYNYVSQTVDNEGNSAASVARTSKPELELLIDYIMFTGGDLKSLVNLQVKKENAKTGKLQISRNKSNKTKIVIGKAKDTSKANNDNIL